MKRIFNLYTLALLLCLSTAVFSAQDYIDKRRYESDDAMLDALGRPLVTDYDIDLDGDNKFELVRIIYRGGVSDSYLIIKIYSKYKNLISTLEGKFGIQSNYKIEDTDGNGKKEIIIWSGLWDFRLPEEDGVTWKTYEGHSAPHRYVVATYKLLRGRYWLWDIYTTKKKYKAWCEEQPK